jgi:hypothetical protein
MTVRVRTVHPDFVFLAEVYWDLEGALVDQGFDYCYDKRLYDRLLHGNAHGIRAHLGADPAFQARLVRFLENHDEPRAAAAFPPDRLRAAAFALLTLPGTLLLHDGQLEGLRVRVPVQLGRAPDEPPDPEAGAFWADLLEALADVRTGEWRLVDVDGPPSLLAWRWSDHLAVINYGDAPAKGLAPYETRLVRLSERAE